MSEVTEIITSFSGTAVALYPLATAWPYSSGCSSYIYKRVDSTFLAWDPLYGQKFDTAAAECLAPAITSWWNPVDDSETSTALGPTFVCPEAYTAAETVVVSTSTQKVYCCPSGYAFAAAQADARGFPTQCISSVTSGDTLSFLSLTLTDDTTSVSTTVTTADAIITVYAIPVNGYNIVQSTSTSTSSSSSSASTGSSTITSTSTSTSTTTSAASAGGSTGNSTGNSTGVSLGTTVGVSVGVVVGVLLLVALGFFIWRRRRAASRAQDQQPGTSPGVSPPEQYQYPQQQEYGAHTPSAFSNSTGYAGYAGYYAPAPEPKYSPDGTLYPQQQQEQHPGMYELPERGDVAEMPAGRV
ncbi:hypothetical protein BX600DRAFT_474541 [Xylariales sp. PMI_506]|nr:hypothetical protein BX600DRAFT_474541 [Xylariales sp. PMI_506]